MGDNVNVGGVNYSTDDVTTLNGATIAAGTAQTQRLKVQYGDDGTARDVSETYPLPTITGPAVTSTVTNVAASTTSQTLIAANPNRKGLMLHAGSGSATMYVRLGAAAASNAAGGHSFDMGPSQMWEDPFRYTGEVRAVWASAAGFVNITELT